MYKALESHFDKHRLQFVFRDFLAELNLYFGNRLEGYQIKGTVSHGRLKAQCDWMMDSLKLLYIKMDLTLEDFEVRIKEIIYSSALPN
jgi:hypothetical protein